MTTLLADPRETKHRLIEDYSDRADAPLTDEQLLLAYRQSGDQRAFEQLVERYERPLYGYLYRFTGSSEMAEDVFQRTFLQVHLKCGDYESGRKVRPWIFRIARNQAIDVQRRTARHQIPSLDAPARRDDEHSTPAIERLRDEGPAPDARLTHRESFEAVRASLAELPRALQQAVELVYFQGLQYREAADALGIPVGTVKSRLHSALTQLRASAGVLS
jgi:RNA polymerase sigma-70 factor (ECF subfamily)